MKEQIITAFKNHDLNTLHKILPNHISYMNVSKKVFLTELEDKLNGLKRCDPNFNSFDDSPSFVCMD